MKEGQVVFERTIKTRSAGYNNTVATLPPTQTDEYILLFANNQSLWQLFRAATAEQGTPTAQGTVYKIIDRNETYFNFSTATRLEEKEVLDQTYIVQNSLLKINWKITNETKKILDYTVQKAVAQHLITYFQTVMENRALKPEKRTDTASITAWFTNAIPVPAGPAAYQGTLAGLILELELNKGQTVYKALKVSPKVNVNAIKEPKGKRLSAAAYALEKNRQMKEMQKNRLGEWTEHSCQLIIRGNGILIPHREWHG